MMRHSLRDDDFSPSEREEVLALAAHRHDQKASLTWLPRWEQ